MLSWVRRHCRLAERRCRLCAEPSGSVVCEDCLDWFHPPEAVCATCANRLAAPAARCGDCLRPTSALTHIAAPYDYAFPLNRLLHRLKYQSDLAMLPILAALMDEGVLSPELRADVLVPVPLHRWRLRRRGFNQADCIASILSTHTGIPAVNDLVLRQKATQPQPGLSPAARVANLAGAFVIQRPVLGLSVCIVDDVVTTRATLESLAAVLIAGGAVRVSAFALASARH